MYCCVDVGTTKIKLALYDKDLGRVHTESVVVPVSSDGLHDPELVFEAVRQLIRRGKDLGAKSVGLATYRGSVVAWKKDGTPLTPIVTWMNTDPVKTFQKQPLYVKAIAKIPPFDLAISPYSCILRLLRLQEINPDVKAMLASQNCMAWTLESYLVYRLTGKFVSDATNATTTGLIYPENLKHVGLVISIFGMKMPFPNVVENSQPIGTVDGMELAAIIADQQAACLAEGAIRGEVAKLTNGTGTFVDVPVEGYTTIKGLHPMVLLKHRGLMYHGVEGYLPTSGTAVDNLLKLGVLRDYAELETESPSKTHVSFIPALAGLQIPRVPQAKGLIYGLDMSTDRTTLIHSLLSSIAFTVRLVLETSGRRVKSLRANGNLSKSTMLLRLVSAATGLPVERQKDTDGTLRGLAILQALCYDTIKLEEVEGTRREVEVIVEKRELINEGEYETWKRLAESLKNFRT
jgi:glycerol kinase